MGSKFGQPKSQGKKRRAAGSGHARARRLARQKYFQKLDEQLAREEMAAAASGNTDTREEKVISDGTLQVASSVASEGPLQISVTPESSTATIDLSPAEEYTTSRSPQQKTTMISLQSISSSMLIGYIPGPVAWSSILDL
jgi:hypothetical protein